VSLLPKPTLRYYEDYAQSFEEHEEAADAAKRAVSDLLRGNVRGVLSVDARAKDPLSLLDKLRRKEYTNPEDQLKDLVGVRVITQYADDAEVAAAVLEDRLEIDIGESYDQLAQLDTTSFSYRSIHVVASLTEAQAAITPKLGGRWFEIQVRSLLQHAWAEVDHEIKYKSGVAFPPRLERRLAAIAGSLETLDQAFLDMRDTRARLIEEYVHHYRCDADADVDFDAARLIAYLECVRPEGTSILEASTVLPAVHGHIEKVLVDGLRTVGLTTARLMGKALEDKATQALIADHAALLGISAERVSHLAVGLIVIWTENPDVLNIQFPELRFDSDLADTLGFDVL
jgi:ppGpp synthetase/RelA/SpoT-type nucleotidyltranferase